MITVTDLSFTYSKTEKKAIQNIGFDIKPGEIFGFLGPSGAGKTTTQRLIIGLLRNYTGSIEVFGKERSSWSKEFYERIGVAFDFPNLYLKLTGEENLRLINSYYRDNSPDIPGLLDRVGLLSDKDVRVEHYSKGMKMRLNFVRAMLHNPLLLFFDEPSSGLDPVNAHIIREMIMEQKENGRTVFLTTHNMTEAEQLCDRVAFIVDGRIVVIGNPSDLKLEHGRRSIKISYTDDGHVAEREFAMQELGNNSDFIALIKEKEVKTIHSCEATLEDIFIKLTGRRLICD